MIGHRIHSWGVDPVFEDMPDPIVGPHDVLVQVEACGVGLTVLNCINGDLADDRASLPRVVGHELVGRVVEQGSEVTVDLIGQRVTAYFYLICGECEPCRTDREPLCERLGGLVGVHIDGGYAPMVSLPAINAIRIPDELDAVAATTIPDAIATPVHVSARAEIGDGDRVVVIGAAGGVGIHMIQVAAARGADVAGLDLGPKLEAVRARGATAADSSDFASVDADALFAGGRPTVVVDLLGTRASTSWGVEALGRQGRLVALTTFRDRPLSFESRHLVFGELTIVGSRYASRTQVAEAARLLADGTVEAIVGAVTGPDDVLTIHDQLRNGALTGRGALVWT